MGGEWGRAFAQPEVDAILDKAAELGINLIDTAECYGDHLAERLVGDYLARRDRSRWIVATKFGHSFHRFMERSNAFSAADARRQLEASLRALRTERIDLYQFHSGPDEAFLKEDLWETLAAEKQAGRIGHLGVSIMQKGSETQAREARRLGLGTLQVFYNRLDQRAESLYWPAARRDNLGVIARVPLASGLLSGKYRTGMVFPGNDVRSTFDNEKMARDFAEVERIRTSEVPTGMPMSQWAIAWCLRDEVVSAAIVGCKDAAQVAANAAAAESVGMVG